MNWTQNSIKRSIVQTPQREKEKTADVFYSQEVLMNCNHRD